MAYADQPEMTTSKLVSIVIVILIHVFLGYALVTGLAYEAVKKVASDLEVIEIEEEQPEPEEEPPPPEEVQVETPPPPVAPPPIVRTPAPPPPITTVNTPPPAAPIVVTPAPPVVAPPAVTPPPPPPPSAPPTQAKPRGNPGSWATTDDYPSRALREERAGVSGFRLTVGTDGRATSCTITSSSGHADLDEATCRNVQRRARFTPATRDGNPVEGSYSGRIRWEIPN